MSDTSKTAAAGGANPLLAFIVGALVVIAGITAYAVFGDGDLVRGDGIEVSIEGADSGIEKAAEAVDNAVNGN